VKRSETRRSRCIFSAGYRRLRRIPPALRALAILAAFAYGILPALAAEPAAELQDLRQQCVAAAETAQQDERALLSAQRAIVLLQRDADGTERELKETRTEQAQLLAGLARLARNPPEDFGVAPEAPLDRIRTGMLVTAVGPAFARDGQALTREFARLASARQELTTRQAEATVQRDNLKQDYDSLGELVARREAAAQKLAPTEAAATAKSNAADLRELIKALDAKKAVAADPARPKGLRVFDAAAEPMLHVPAAGSIARRFGVPGTSEKPSDGLDLAALPGAIVVAPFDGRVDYAGRFRDRGLVLIIGHGGGYHSVLAGLDRIDAKPGEWVLAGEPVGAMPDTAAAASGTVLTFELRRDGNPVDPFPVLIDSGELTGRDGADDSRVRE
jgi:septal ring factor EnvC (AmiA/AmiB activator)